MAEDKKDGRDPETGRFLTGNNGGGRPKGSRNRVMEASIQALCDDFDIHGVEAMRAFRMRDPGGYTKMVFNLHPKKVEAVLDANVNHSFDEATSVEEIITIVANEAGEEAAEVLAKMFSIDRPKIELKAQAEPEPIESREERIKQIQADRKRWGNDRG